MSTLKTQRTKASVAEFLGTVEDPGKRADAKAMRALMANITGKRAAMWGASIVGFDSYHYESRGGYEADWPITGFSPRKQALSIYIMNGFSSYGPLMKKLGKYKLGKGCLYVKSLDDIDLTVLEELITRSVHDMRKKYHKPK